MNPRRLPAGTGTDAVGADQEEGDRTGRQVERSLVKYVTRAVGGEPACGNTQRDGDPHVDP